VDACGAGPDSALRFIDRQDAAIIKPLGPSGITDDGELKVANARRVTETDWRSDRSALSYEVVSVPDAVADGVSRYLKAMNLVYAGLDFVVTPDGRWVMLEANSGPQFGWLEAATGAPMAAAMASLLAEGNT
jgi:glutathione synthase/RimK-type ligase-like ATP-grasp enzyme